MSKVVEVFKSIAQEITKQIPSPRVGTDVRTAIEEMESRIGEKQLSTIFSFAVSNPTGMIDESLRQRFMLASVKDVKQLPIDSITLISPQYRGTIISGSRKTGLVVSKDAKHECRLNNLLGEIDDDTFTTLHKIFVGIYLNLFGLRDTIAEKFIQYSERTGANKLGILEISFGKKLLIEEYSSDSQVGFYIQFPNKESINLLPDEIPYSLFNSTLNAINANKNKGEIFDSIVKEFDARLGDHRARFSYDLRIKDEWKSIEDISRKLDGVKTYHVYNDHPSIDSVLRAWQGLYLYSFLIGEHFLIVSLPSESFQPRMSTVIACKEKPEDDVKQLLLDATDGALSEVRDFVQKRVRQLAGQKQISHELPDQIYNEYSEHVVNCGVAHEDFKLLFPFHNALFRFMSEIRRKLIHEDKRFRLNVIIGRDYHIEKYFQRPIYTLDQSTEIYKFCEDKGSFGPLMRLISGHYSILDSADIALFASYGESLGELKVTHIINTNIDEYSVPRREFRLQVPISENLEKISRLHPEIVCCSISTGRQLKIYHGGSLIIEENDEGWVRVQAYKEFCEKISELFDEARISTKTDNERKEQFYKVLRFISDEPGVGACFVFGDYAKLKRDNLVVPMSKLLGLVEGQSLQESNGPAILYKASIMDGATIIDTTSDELKIHPRMQIACAVDIYTEQLHRGWIATGPKCWESGDWEEVFHWGARRLSALSLSVKSPNLVIIVVSADGPIKVFHNGTCKAGYPD